MAVVTHTLYLGSQSKTRQRLLDVAGIPYKILRHDSDECVVNPGLSFAEYVGSIAKEKMQHIVLPQRKDTDTDELFILTADTLVQLEGTGEVLEKPQDRQDAIRMLRLLRDHEALVVTACCLEKKAWRDNAWHTVATKEFTASATMQFSVEEEYIETYLEKMPMALHACSAGIIDGYGENFLVWIKGSHSTVQGLPLYELRQALKEFGF